METFTLFNEKNIGEYYTKNILKEQTDEEKTTAEILKDAKELHEDLRNYGSIQDKDKPLIVSGILLALREIEHKNFDIDNLNGDDVKTDGQKIYEAIQANLERAQVKPQVKKDKLLSQFLVIRDTKAINETNSILGKTPLKHYTQFIYDQIHSLRRRLFGTFLRRIYVLFGRRRADAGYRANSAPYCGALLRTYRYQADRFSIWSLLWHSRFSDCRHAPYAAKNR